MLKLVCETAWPCYDICINWDFLKFQSFALPRNAPLSAIKVFYLSLTANESFLGYFAKHHRTYHPKYSVTSTKTSMWQARDQEFFRAGEVFWNEGTLINILSTTRWRKAPQGKISEFYLLEALKTAFQMRHLTHRCTQSASLNITFFKAQTDCPVEKMLRRARLISDRTSDKNLFWKKSGHREFVWLLKQFGANVVW